MRFASDREKMFIGRNQLIQTVSWQIKTNQNPKNIFVFMGASGIFSKNIFLFSSLKF